MNWKIITGLFMEYNVIRESCMCLRLHVEKVKKNPTFKAIAHVHGPAWCKFCCTLFDLHNLFTFSHYIFMLLKP